MMGRRVLSVSKLEPTCRVCNTPLFLLDEEAQRWYCYRDDEVYYAKDQRWGEHRLTTPITPTTPMSRKSLVRYHLCYNVWITTMALSYSITFGVIETNWILQFISPFLLFGGVAILVVGYLTIPKKERESMTWLCSIWFSSFRRPFDKYGMVLSIWFVVAAIWLGADLVFGLSHLPYP